MIKIFLPDGEMTGETITAERNQHREPLICAGNRTLIHPSPCVGRSHASDSARSGRQIASEGVLEFIER